MVGADDAAVFLLEGLVALDGGQVAGGEDDAVQLVALVVDGLQGAEGDECLVRLTRVVVEPHYLIGHTAGVDKPPDGVGVRFAEEDFGRLVVEHDDLAPLLQVRLVDKASRGDFHRLRFAIVGIHTHQRQVDVFLPVADVDASLLQGGACAGHVFAELRFSVLYVAVVQLDAPSFLQAVVGLGGPAGEDADGVERAVHGVLLEGMDEAVARAQQHDEHEDAPCHGETRQEGAQLVAPQGAVYFLPKVNHIVFFRSYRKLEGVIARFGGLRS